MTAERWDQLPVMEKEKKNLLHYSQSLLPA